MLKNKKSHSHKVKKIIKTKSFKIELTNDQFTGSNVQRMVATVATDAITATLTESKRRTSDKATVVAMQRGNGHNLVTNSICRNKRTPTSTCRHRAYLPHCR